MSYRKPDMDDFVNTWTTQEGKVIAIKDLEDEHLKNILLMLRGKYSEEHLVRREQFRNLVKEDKKRFKKKMLKTKLGKFLYRL